jgi:DNA-binding response OmpR family regulator
MPSAGNTVRILVVDDDPRLCRFVLRFLGGEGYAADAAHDGSAMRRALASAPFDLILLDLTFPSGEDGISLARGLRAQYDIPLIMLSGKNVLIDKVVCLEMGADDYVTKPFEPRELLARIRTVLRRAFGRADVCAPERTYPDDTVLTFANWRLDLARRQLFSPEREIVALTSVEFQLLAALARRPGRVLSREQILDMTANRRWTPYDRSVDVMIGKIRRKMCDNLRQPTLIKTIRGVGYMLAAPATGR